MKLIENVGKLIRTYASFTSAKSFAVRKLKAIIDWLWLSKDMNVVSEGEFKTLYDLAIDAIVELETP